jgi:NADP-dependent aldehyde dehydrogenase
MIRKNIIGFDLSSGSGKNIYAFDPGKLIQLPEAFSTATSEEVNKALEKAQAAWRIFRSMESKQKASFLSAIASGIEDLGDILVHRMMQETAYHEARVITERNRTCAQLRMYADILQREEWRDISVVTALPDRTPVPRPDLRRMNMAIGPVIVFAASNFPLAYSTAGGDTTSALAAGCPVIVKAHESHLGTNALVAEVIMDASKSTGMPDGVFSSLNGDGILTGQQLVMHPLTAGVGFTGSLSGGRALFDLGQKREKPIPVFTEMGSVNPIFLLPGKVKADMENISTLLVNSITNSMGQFCTKPGLLFFIDGEETQQMISRLEDLFHSVPSGTMLNENIAGNYEKGIATLKMDSGVVIVNSSSSNQKMKGQPLLATVHADIFLSNPKLHHEVFGPFSLIVLCRDFKQMQEAADALEGQLTATVHAIDEESAASDQLIHILVEKAGRIIFNGVPTGVEVCAAMTHGGPYPASSDSRFTAVGDAAIRRWLRPVTFQNFPESLLPQALREI